MTREEKCVYLIDKGYTYNPETGEVKNPHGKVLKNKEIQGYTRLTIIVNNKLYFLRQHQFAWYFMYGECVECLDHINGITDDNRICNLRSVTFQQNQFNQTKAKGYTWNKKDKKFQSQIKINNKTIYLGSFNTEEDARKTYLIAKEKYHII
jgi:hypothetical protein